MGFEIKYLKDCGNYLNLSKDICQKFPEITEELLGKLRNIKLPVRETENAAAYDLSLPYAIDIAPKSCKEVFFGWVTGLTDEDGDTDYQHRVLMSPRSSLCKKKGLILLGDYKEFGDNELLICKFKNVTDELVHIDAGERLVQILFVKNLRIGLKFDGGTDIQHVARVGENGVTICADEADTYFFENPEDIELAPYKVTFVMTGLKWKFDTNRFLCLEINPTLDDSLMMANGIGIVDADYYNNESNEGEIGFPIFNNSSNVVKLEAGTTLGTGQLFNFYTREGDAATGKRTGGFGSTDKEG